MSRIRQVVKANDTEAVIGRTIHGFTIFFDDENRDETLRQLARFAADPELDFSWYDAAMLSRKIRDAVPSDDDLLASQEFDSLSMDDFH